MTNGHTTTGSDIVSWVHFGDLHLTTAAEANYRDFLALVQEANGFLAKGVNFAVLPGDNAEDGTEEQYRLVRFATDQLTIPIHAIPGDHDFKNGSLGLFQKYLEQKLWRSFSLGSYQFVFLNSLERTEGHEFDFSGQQVEWLEQELQNTTAQGLRAVLFMHTYPSELGLSARRIGELIRVHRVLLVEMGHTHYNELANDGGTLYATTRSTGQIEEGPVGFSITNLDNGVVSWKFKELGRWPFAMITSPIERRLITEPSRPDHLVQGCIEIRAKEWGMEDKAVATAQINDGPLMTMAPTKSRFIWACHWDSTQVEDGRHRLTVRFQDAKGPTAEDEIEILVSQEGDYESPTYAARDVDNAIGAYPEKGILGTQLGPNKNGRKW